MRQLRLALALISLALLSVLAASAWAERRRTPSRQSPVTGSSFSTAPWPARDSPSCSAPSRCPAHASSRTLRRLHPADAGATSAAHRSPSVPGLRRSPSAFPRVGKIRSPSRGVPPDVRCASLRALRLAEEDMEPLFRRFPPAEERRLRAAARYGRRHEHDGTCRPRSRLRYASLARRFRARKAFDILRAVGALGHRFHRLQAVTDAALSYAGPRAPSTSSTPPALCSTPTRARSCCWTRSGTSSSRTRRSGSRRTRAPLPHPRRQGLRRTRGCRAAARRAPDVEHADVLNPLIRRKGIASLVGVPLVVEGRPISVLHVGTLERRNFTRDEVDLLQLAADRVAIALSHARAFEAERAARRQVEHVQAIVDTSLAHLELDALLDELLDRIRAILGVDTCAVLLVDPERRDLFACAAVGLEEEVEQGIRIPLGKGFAGRNPPRAGRSACPTSITRTWSIRCCARRGSSPCSAYRSPSGSTSSASSTSARCRRGHSRGTTPSCFSSSPSVSAWRSRRRACIDEMIALEELELQLRRCCLARAANTGDGGLRHPDDAA